MRFTLRFFTVNAGTLLAALGLVVLAACNHGDRVRMTIPDLCGAEVSDLVGTWVLNSPAPDVVSKLSSCSDPSLDGTPIEFNPLCLAPLPCGFSMTFEVPGVEQGPGGTIGIEGSGSGGRDRLLGIFSLETCNADLTIIQADNPVNLRCHGILHDATRTIDLICDAAWIQRSPDGPTFSCEVRPPIEGQITITPSGGAIPL